MLAATGVASSNFISGKERNGHQLDGFQDGAATVHGRRAFLHNILSLDAYSGEKHWSFYRFSLLGGKEQEHSFSLSFQLHRELLRAEEKGRM